MVLRATSHPRTAAGAPGATAAVVVLLLCAVACLWPAAGWSKSYSIVSMHVDATVNPDGSMAVVEEVTYAFRGGFKFAFRDIPLNPGETLSEVSVRDLTGVYRRAANDDQSPGTFIIVTRGSGKRITWFYRATDERRTFEFSFVVAGVVKRHPDVAELYYKFVGGDWDRMMGDVRVTVHPPPETYRSDIRAWAHGPLNGTVAINADGTVDLNVSRLPARTFWEGRILYPAERFGGMEPARGSPALSAIMDEERAWVEAANRRRQERIEARKRWAAERARKKRLAGKFLIASLIGTMVGFLWWYRAFRLYGLPHRVTPHSAPGEIPSPHRPAILSYLLYRGVTASAIVATLLDLADRGYFSITETTHEKKGWFGRTRREKDYRFDLTKKRMEDLVPFELQLVEFMITEAGDVTGFTMSGLKKTATRNRTAFRKWFMKWTKEIKQLGKTMDFYEPYPTMEMVVNAVIGVVLLGIGIVFVKLTGLLSGGVVAIGGGAAILFLTIALQRRTVDGKRLQVAWMAFRKHLVRVGKGLGPVRLDSSTWGRYMAAAIIFGMHKQLFPKLELVGDDGRAMAPVWFYGQHGSGAGSFDDSLSSLAAGLTTMVNTVSTTMSSASGTGGGASGGGGGGSGGGGGGAG